MENSYLFFGKILGIFVLILLGFPLYAQSSQAVFNQNIHSESDFEDIVLFLYRHGKEEYLPSDLDCRISYDLYDKEGNCHKFRLYKENTIEWSLDLCYLLVEIHFLDATSNSMTYFFTYKVTKDGIVDLDYSGREFYEAMLSRREAMKDSFNHILSKANPSKVKKL